MEDRPDIMRLCEEGRKIRNKLRNIICLNIDRPMILEKIKSDIPELYQSAEIRSISESKNIEFIKFIVETIPYTYKKIGTYISANNPILLNYMKFLKYVRDIINSQCATLTE